MTCLKLHCPLYLRFPLFFQQTVRSIDTIIFENIVWHYLIFAKSLVYGDFCCGDAAIKLKSLVLGSLTNGITCSSAVKLAYCTISKEHHGFSNGNTVNTYGSNLCFSLNFLRSARLNARSRWWFYGWCWDNWSRYTGIALQYLTSGA